MELIAVILTLICVILTVKLNIWCWFFSILASIAYMYVFYQQNIYFQILLQFIFIGQSIYGWYNWRKISEPVKPTSSWLGFLIGIYSVLIFTIILISVLHKKTNNPQLSLDIFTTLLSLFGTWLLARKNVFGWLVWIITDIFLIKLFLNQELYWSATLYVVLLILSTKGLIQWIKNTETV